MAKKPRKAKPASTPPPDPAAAAADQTLEDALARAQARLGGADFLDDGDTVMMGGGLDFGAAPPGDTPLAAAGVQAWSKVSFDATAIHLQVAPPGRAAWTAAIPWSSIVRLVFECHDLSSDSLYVFVRERPESYVIPLEGHGVSALWAEIIDRKLFDPELAIQASRGAEGAMFIWPPVDP